MIFYYLQLIGGIISAVLLVGIVYLIIKLQVINQNIEKWTDIWGGASKLSQRRVIKGWQQILRHLRSRDPKQWREAILLADNMLDDILKMAGYVGNNIEGRLSNITAAQIKNIEELRKAHHLAVRIKDEADYQPNKEAADEAAYEYRKAFEELRLLG